MPSCWSQAEAERRKRAQILESEGDRQSKINVAEGEKAQVILSSEAAKQDSINRAEGALHLPGHKLGSFVMAIAKCNLLSYGLCSYPPFFCGVLRLSSQQQDGL